MNKLILVLMLAVFMLGAVPAMADPIDINAWLKIHDYAAWYQYYGQYHLEVTKTPAVINSGTHFGFDWSGATVFTDDITPMPMDFSVKNPALSDTFDLSGSVKSLALHLHSTITDPSTTTFHLTLLSNASGEVDGNGQLVAEEGFNPITVTLTYNSETNSYDYDDVHTPEPATVVGLGLAAIAVGWRRLRKRLTGR